MQTIKDLVQHFAHGGKVEWIGVRPARKEPLIHVERVAVYRTGLEGDHRKKAGKRTLTLLQAEHLPAIASLCGAGIGGAPLTPDRLRRNIVVSGISLLGLRDKCFSIGTTLLKGSGLCAPCSRMETELGFGGYNAMRGHGGICAEVLQEGEICLGDAVHFIPPPEDLRI